MIMFVCRLLSPTISVNTKQPARTKIYYSRRRGTAKHISAVTDRFFRLHNGMWIRPQAGRDKKRWIKSARRRNRLKDHLFLTRIQCKLLDRMTLKYWKEKKYYVNDVYEHYHKESNLPIFKYDKPKFLP